MIESEVIESHQDEVPSFGESHARGPTPLTFRFDTPLESIESTLDRIFEGVEPYFAPGICRPITTTSTAYSVTAKLCPPSPGIEYDFHEPIQSFFWCDVTADQLDMYVSEECEAWRVITFLEVLQEDYSSFTYDPSLSAITDQDNVLTNQPTDERPSSP